MAIKSITQDYSNRKKDISILHGGTPSEAGGRPVNVKFGNVSSYCAGVQKLIQRYAISLLTNLGSQANYPEFGTDFLVNIQRGSNVSSGDLTHLFNFANMETLNVFREYQSQFPNDPLDEQLNSATLKDVIVSGDMVHFNITIFTRAGNEIDFLMPLPESN